MAGSAAACSSTLCHTCVPPCRTDWRPWTKKPAWLARRRCLLFPACQAKHPCTPRSLRDCAPATHSNHIMLLLRPFAGMMPTTEAHFNQLVQQLRRHGHVFRPLTQDEVLACILFVWCKWRRCRLGPRRLPGQLGLPSGHSREASLLLGRILCREGGNRFWSSQSGLEARDRFDRSRSSKA